MGFAWADPADNLIPSSGSIQQYYQAEERLAGFVHVSPKQWDEESLKQFLMTHGIDTEQYGKGKAKSLTALTKELLRGETTFMIDGTDSSLIRYVEIVWTKILSAEGKILIEKERVYTDGKKRQVDRMPGGKRRPLESVISAAKRILAKELELPMEVITLDSSTNTLSEIDTDAQNEDIRESPSYPGMKSCYRIFIVPVELDMPSMDEDLLADLGLPENAEFTSHEVTGDKHNWAWMDIEAAEKCGALSFDSVEAQPTKFDAFKPAMENGWDDGAVLKSLLDLYEIDDAGGLQVLQNELKEGKLQLLENSSVNSMIVVKNLVALRAAKDGNLLCDMDHKSLPTIESSRNNIKLAAQKLLEVVDGQVSGLGSTVKLSKELIFYETKHDQVPIPMVVRQHIADVV